jgi:4-hydroxy-2-oxoheptanedioate aldolase
VDDLLAATGPDDPIPRILAAAEQHGKLVVSFAGEPSLVPAFRALGIEALAVATDLAPLDLGTDRALGDLRG